MIDVVMTLSLEVENSLDALLATRSQSRNSKSHAIPRGNGVVPSLTQVMTPVQRDNGLVAIVGCLRCRRKNQCSPNRVVILGSTCGTNAYW